MNSAAANVIVTIALPAWSYLLGHRSLIFPAALCGGISSALSMVGGEWLSDSRNGLGASCVMGGGCHRPRRDPAAIPYAFETGPVAVAQSVVICVCIGIAAALMWPRRGLGMALTEVFG